VAETIPVEVVSVDAESGQKKGTRLVGFQILPPTENVCQVCGVDHPDDQPHDWTSLVYQYQFYARQSRWPTWADAAAHCQAVIQAMWKAELERRGRPWGNPEGGPVVGLGEKPKE
jgi:hypothetical protein